MKILIVLTSHDTLGDTGKKTGFWLEEFAAPYYALKGLSADFLLITYKYKKGRHLKMKALSTISAAVLAITSQMVHATEVFRLEGSGPISRAMGGTATAFDVGAAGMMTNPATLSLMAQGSELHLGLDVVNTDIDTQNLATGENASSNN